MLLLTIERESGVEEFGDSAIWVLKGLDRIK
jgi:hypothetical protein